jgi:uncharacterized protein YfaS (alpha-2-macroglobulin family)
MANPTNNSNKELIGDPKNVAIALLVLIVLVMGFLLINNLRQDKVSIVSTPPGGEKVSVVEVKFDKENNEFVDFIFNRPVGESGEVLGRDPGKITPSISGSWTWISPNTLRFQPSGRFNIATDYSITLLPDLFLKEGQTLSGKKEFEIRTDKFQVEQSTIDEEPTVDKKNTVILNGTLRFNYSVDPGVLVRKIKLYDGTSGDKEVPIKLITNYWDTTIKWESGPVEKTKNERDLQLEILGDLTSADGNVPLGEDFRETILLGSKDNLVVRNVDPKAKFPESSITISFSSAVSPDIASDYISVVPDAKYKIQRIQNRLILKGNFKPGGAYKLNIEKGLPAVDDAGLQEPYSKDISFSNLSPSVEFESAGMFLDSKGTQALNLKTINVEKISINIDRVFLNNLSFLFQSYGYSVWRDEYYQGSIGNYFGDRITEMQNIKIDSKLNQEIDTVIDLKKYIPQDQPGLYQVGIIPEGQYQGAQRWVLITDIGIVSKKGQDDFLVWTSSFSDLDPISGAEVNIISEQNQVIKSGITDASGMYKLSGTKKLFEKQNPYMVQVKKGDDFSFLLFETMEIDTSGLDVGGAYPSEKGYTAFAYGERDIYRPGETVRGIAIIRDLNLNKPKSMPVILKQTDPRGRVLKTFKEIPNNEGILSFEIPLPDFAATGNYVLEILIGDSLIGQYDFQVEEFIPDRIKVKINPENDVVQIGQQLSYEVSSSYLFGPPASNLAVETSVDLVERPFLPESYKGYVFTNEDRKFKSREIFKQDGKLNQEGSTSFSLDIPDGLRPPSSLQAQITARVQETGGRGVTSKRMVNVDPYPYYLGIKEVEPDKYAEPGQEVEFEFVALSEKDGKTGKTVEVKTGALKAELLKDTWNTVLRKTASGNYKYESERDSALIDSKVIDNGLEKGTFTFTPPEFGSYRVTLSDPLGGASTQIQFYASGWGFSPWALKNPARIELDLEKEEYMPGETATVQVRAPFSGELLITVERDDIYYTQTHTMDGNTATIPIPVNEQYRPNAYVTATLIRSVKDLEPGSAARAFGAIPISVDRSSNKMDIEITAPKEIRPLNPLNISVKTVPQASVTIAAVDEGILQLIDQKSADPFTFFYKKLALVVKSYDTFSLLLPDVALEKSQPGGGFAAKRELQFLSTQGIRRVQPVAFWSSVLKADEEGIAKVEFDVPEFQGALRIMATAIKGKQFGSSDAYTRVKSPIVILPTVPRFISLNDKVVLPVSVRNDTGSDGTIKVNLLSEGPVTVSKYEINGSDKDNSVKATNAELNLEIPKGAEKMVYFELNSSDTTGAVKLIFKASGNGESSQVSIDVPVLPDLPKSTSEGVGRISSAETVFDLVNKDNYRPGTLSRDLSISKLPLIQFSGKLEYLLGYPFGCLEQTTSKIFPLIYMSEIAKELDPEIFKDSDPEAMVQDGIRRISGMQVSGGGFSLWPGSQDVDPWASIYASHFLVEAKRAGFYIQESVYSGAISFLKNETRAKQSYSTGELERVVYALYVLSREGQADLSTMDFIRERHIDDLTAESRAFLAGAYASQGDTGAFDDLLAGIKDVEQVERQTGENFNSTIRNRAILLLAILEVNPDDSRVPELVDRLSGDAQINQYWTTQESSFALLAIGEFVKKQYQSDPYSGKVYLGDKEIGSFSSDKMLTLTGIQGDGSLRIKMDEGYQNGSAFFSLITRGNPTKKGFKPVADGLQVERAFLTRDGAPINVDQIEQGDLIVLQTKIQSEAGRLDNVVIQNLLPSGFEVENPRLKTTETLTWATGNSIEPEYLDIRDDRILVFTDIPDAKWYNYYSLLRAVNPGVFVLPPVQAEAMYSPNIRFTGKLEEPLRVEVRN